VNRGGRCTRFLRWRPLRYCGKICYGLYLLQLPAEILLLVLLGRLGFGAPDTVWMTLAKMAATLALASLSWRLFEQPLLRLRDRFRSPSHPAALAAAGSVV
jgi:peptidoglycan/LPS O-acetylase OafA/YrhL